MSVRKLFRLFRIFLLLTVLFIVAVGSWLTTKRSTDWEHSLWVVIYPINADGKNKTREYIHELRETDFRSIETFITEQASLFKVPLNRPLTVRLGPEVNSFPPAPPSHQAAKWEIMLWSLKLRYWAFQNDDYDGPNPNIRMFVNYYQGEKNKALQHSLGLQKGMLGIVNAFASNKMTGSNNVVITHEILHTLGASDKYDLSSGQPVYPSGYANPARVPRYPQDYAEIMGGKIPVSEHESDIPRGLHQVMMGKQTAREINWIN